MQLPILGVLGEAMKSVIIPMIVFELQTMFALLNLGTGYLGDSVGKTPAQWNPDIFAMMQSLAENVMLPVGGSILAIVLTVELIQMVTEKNNMHDVDTWMFFKWIFKAAVSVLILSNVWNIVMGVFDVGQYVTQQAAGVISQDIAMDMDVYFADLETKLRAMDYFTLYGVLLQISIVTGLSSIGYLIIFVISYGRMIEIFLTTSMAPVPLAALANREWGEMGKNYLRALFALAFQGFLIMACMGIYAALMRGVIVQDDIVMALWTCMGYTALLCFALVKTGSLSKSILNAR